jgi:hypothetical protein
MYACEIFAKGRSQNLFFFDTFISNVYNIFNLNKGEAYEKGSDFFPCCGCCSGVHYARKDGVGDAVF